MNDDQKFTTKVIQIVQDYLKSSAFSDRKLTDTPTDALAVVNRKYVTANGSTALRPPAPVAGQYYFDTSIGYPVWYNGSVWVNSVGTPV